MKYAYFLIFLVLSVSCASPALAIRSFQDEFVLEHLSFDFHSKKFPVSGSVVSDEIIDIDPFEAPGAGVVDLPQFRIIFGKGSISIFDALGVSEIAGLKRIDAEQKIDQLKAVGKSEAEGAFIAGLTNIHGRQIFMFFNLDRLNSSLEYAHRVLAHEPLHMARFLITTIQNPNVDYINDPYVKLDDDNEEYFAEVLERVTTIALNRYQKIHH